MIDHPLSGICALHPDWPEARFNISGLFVYDRLVLYFLDLVQNGYACRVPIEAVHGAPSVRWNGGRIMPVAFRPAELDARLAEIYSRNVGCFLTFTNHLLEARDLSDPLCNFLLDHVACRPDLNAVLVSSDLLSKYIAARYPALRQVASITKVVREGGRGNAAYYRELGKRFFRYVVHPDDSADLRLLDQLDRDKTEILVNENCARDCPQRARHMDLIAEEQKICADNPSAGWEMASGDELPAPLRRVAEEVARLDCSVTPLEKQVNQGLRNCNLTRTELKSIYEMGFRYFKLQGRKDVVHLLVYDLVRFTMEPEQVAPLVFKVMCKMVNAVLMRR